ncbi:hypothetical protein F4818DRAFT_440787 [Hypoxylon cercidicola]|nr:hypothetical protein F4818DRAFT_440787 [Hypoxylon cercidicola]
MPRTNGTSHRSRRLTTAPPRSVTHRPPTLRTTRRTQAAFCRNIVRRLRAHLLTTTCPSLPFRRPYPLYWEPCSRAGYRITLYIQQAQSPHQEVRVDPHNVEFWQLLEGEALYGVESRPQMHMLPIGAGSWSAAFVRDRDSPGTGRDTETSDDDAPRTNGTIARANTAEAAIEATRANGSNGTNGTGNNTNGADGTSGTNGVDGTHGINGHSHTINLPNTYFQPPEDWDPYEQRAESRNPLMMHPVPSDQLVAPPPSGESHPDREIREWAMNLRAGPRPGRPSDDTDGAAVLWMMRRRLANTMAALADDRDPESPGSSAAAFRSLSFWREPREMW